MFISSYGVVRKKEIIYFNICRTRQLGLCISKAKNNDNSQACQMQGVQQEKPNPLQDVL